MYMRMGHRLRWAIVWTLLVAWVAFIVFDWGGRFANALLFLAVIVLVYELLAAETA